MEIHYQSGRGVVDMYDYYEVTIMVDDPPFTNPFTDVEVFGLFGVDREPFTFTYGMPGGRLGQTWNRDELIPVDGFCDSDDGSVYRIRFMPRCEGVHRYTVTFRYAESQWTTEGTFEARQAGRRGLLKVDPEHPFHFIWEGTGEHFFYNGMTAYHLFGIRDETLIMDTLDRFQRGKVNRIRAALSSSSVPDASVWFEPVVNSDQFTFRYGPWVSRQQGDSDEPDWDGRRFDPAYWRMVERTLSYARDRDLAVSVILYLDAYRPGVEPYGKSLMGGQDEQRYFRYAAARLGAFSNVTWDLTNEYRLVRPHEWVERMGYFLRSCDPYRHLMTCHGHPTFEFRTSRWADFAVYQSWDEEGGYAYMLRNRRLQEETGTIMPQVNEEFGYEDHYPAWGEGKRAPERSADRLRRIAWEIYMAGGYQTAGERADNGIGGWINGRGDDSMTLLQAFAPIVTFFESCDWWRTSPDDACLRNEGGFCLSEAGALYLVYLPSGEDVRLELEAGRYEAVWYNPRRGHFDRPLPVVTEGGTVLLACPDRSGDMALRLTRQHRAVEGNNVKGV